MGVKTIKRANPGCIWLFGHRSKSVDVVLASGLQPVCPLCLWHNSTTAAAVAACGAM